MKKVLVFFFFLTGYIFSQNIGRIKAGAGFSPGFISRKTQSVQIHGLLGWKNKEEPIELRGEGFYFVNSFGENPRFSTNHQLFAGAFYVFSPKNFQSYLGFQPGIAFSKALNFGSWNAQTQEIEYRMSVNPVFACVAGFDLYADKWFFLFAEMRQILGKHTSDTTPLSLREFRFSFGSGFYFSR